MDVKRYSVHVKGCIVDDGISDVKRLDLPPMSRLARTRVDVKGYSVDVKGYGVDV